MFLLIHTGDAWRLQHPREPQAIQHEFSLT
jgi:hypothetical protein